jgi:glutathione S-transferase
MMLFQHPHSPYVRKVRMFAIEAGLEERIHLVHVDPREPESGLREHNPLARIPTLVTDDDVAIHDSRVILEYLDHLNEGRKLFPPSGPLRWQALTRAAIGDGIVDAAVPRRNEMQRPKPQQSEEHLERLRLDVSRALNKLEASTESLRIVDVGTVSVANALAYLDFRFPGEQWRNSRPRLAGWFDGFATRRSLRETDPRG